MTTANGAVVNPDVVVVFGELVTVVVIGVVASESLLAVRVFSVELLVSVVAGVSDFAFPPSDLALFPFCGLAAAVLVLNGKLSTIAGGWPGIASAVCPGRVSTVLP